MPIYRNDRLFDWANNLFLILMCVMMLSPSVHLAAVPVSAPQYVGAKHVRCGR